MKFKKEEILKAMKSFSRHDCEIIECLYGIGGKSFKNTAYIKERFFISDNYLENLKSRLLKRMFAIRYEDKLINYSRGSIDNANQDFVYKMSEQFYNMFENFNSVYVEDKVNKLPQIYKETLYLLYGLDGLKCLHDYEIAKVFNITVEEVNKLSKNAIEVLNEMLNNSCDYATNYEKNINDKYKQLISLYGEESVKSALLLLPDLTRNLIEEYFASSKLSFKEVGVMYEIKTVHVHKHIKDGLDKVAEILNDKSFFNSFSKKYGKEFINHVKLAIYELDNKRRDIMISFLGLNVQRQNISELSKNFKISEKDVKYIIRTNILFIEGMVDQLSKKNKKSLG